MFDYEKLGYLKTRSADQREPNFEPLEKIADRLFEEQKKEEALWSPEERKEWGYANSKDDFASAMPFMWMHCEEGIDKNGNFIRIHLYKHNDTRRYINIDEEGNYYHFVDYEEDKDGAVTAYYEETDEEDAIEALCLGGDDN